ncbi:MAG: M42 family metallopeptidase [Caldisericia bacterium]|nr:M42 family metallopeptidase [Caldisericia bacterium]
MLNRSEYIDYIENILVLLCNIPSPSGFTESISNEVTLQLKELELIPSKTLKNSVLCDTKTNGETLTLAAHLDTLGAIVRSIKSNGRIRLSKIGGWSENTVSGENCLIHTYNGDVFTGTVQYTSPAVHVYKSVGDKKLENEIEVVIDRLVKNKEDVAMLGIENGNFISFDPRTTITKSGFIKSRHLDDKAGAAILLALAKWIQKNKTKVNKNVHLLFTTYEEVGHGGASGVSASTKEMISVDMGAVGDDLLGTEEKVSICAKDSGGPYDYSLTKSLVNIAKNGNLDYVVDVFPYYGSDVEVTLRAGYDIKHGLIGPGVFASHGYERTHIDGILNTLLLLIHYITQ